MNVPSPAPAQIRLSESQSDAELRQRYEESLVTAMQFAERYLPRDQALEIAHEVASMTLTLAPARVTTALIYVAVTNRLRSFWRSTKRRALLEGAYHDFLSSAVSMWADPDVELVIQEMQRELDMCIAEMPPRMREVFRLVRTEELSYKETAARLRISVGTVHTQFSRATALLRSRIARYQGDTPAPNQSRRKPEP